MFQRSTATYLLLCLSLMALPAARCLGQAPSSLNSHDYLAHLAAANSALRLNEASEARRWLDEIPEAARSWEWQLLNAKTDSSSCKLVAEKWTQVRLDLSPGGDQLAVAGDDGFVRIIEADSLKQVAEWKVSEMAVYAARFHPHKNQLAICARDGNLSLWDIETKSKLWSQKSGGEGLADLVFRPDGQQLLFCSWFRGPQTVLGTVSTWAVNDGSQLWKTEFGVKPIVTARYSPDGKHFAVGTWDALVGVWSVEELGEPKVFDFSDRPQYSAIDDIAFSPDSNLIAAATKNGTPRIWSLLDSQPPVDMAGHTNAVFSIAFSADGKSLLTGGSDGVLAVWDIAQRIQTFRFYGHQNRIISISVSPENDRITTASADRTIRAWSLNSAKTYESPSAGKYVYGLVVADKGQLLVSAGQSDTTVSVWDATNKQAIRHFAGTDSTINFLDGDGGDWVAGGNWNGDVRIWNVKTGELIRSMGSKELGGMQQCALSDNQKWLASATNKKQVVIWDAQTGDLAKTIPVPDGCWGLDFSADGQTLVVGDGKGSIHWISTSNWETLWTESVGTSQINAVRIAPSGKWLAAGSEGGTLAIFDVPTQKIRHLTLGHSQRIWTLDISPDESRIVTGAADHKLKTWDPVSGASLLTIADFTAPIYNVRYSTDGKSLYVNVLGAQLVRLTVD